VAAHCIALRARSALARARTRARARHRPRTRISLTALAHRARSLRIASDRASSRIAQARAHLYARTAAHRACCTHLIAARCAQYVTRIPGSILRHFVARIRCVCTRLVRGHTHTHHHHLTAPAGMDHSPGSWILQEDASPAPHLFTASCRSAYAHLRTPLLATLRARAFALAHTLFCYAHTRAPLCAPPHARALYLFCLAFLPRTALLRARARTRAPRTFAAARAHIAIGWWRWPAVQHHLNVTLPSRRNAAFSRFVAQHH